MEIGDGRLEWFRYFKFRIKMFFKIVCIVVLLGRMNRCNAGGLIVKAVRHEAKVEQEKAKEPEPDLYRVVFGTNFKTLAIEVNVLMRRNWKPLGSIVQVNALPDGTPCASYIGSPGFMQAMVLE